MVPRLQGLGSIMVRTSIFGFVLLLLAASFVGVSPAGAVVDSARIVPSPSPGTNDDELFSVSCVSVSSCTALGYTWRSLSQAHRHPQQPHRSRRIRYCPRSQADTSSGGWCTAVSADSLLSQRERVGSSIPQLPQDCSASGLVRSVSSDAVVQRCPKQQSSRAVT